MNRRSLLQAGGVAAGAGFGLPGVAPRPRERDAVRVVVWNIFRGGTGVAPDNLDLLLDQLVELRPDVFLAVETYGAGPAITEALTRRARNGRYRGIPITRRTDDSDNLWIFTHLPVVAELPRPAAGGVITDFNLGGVRVRTRGGRELNAFALWINYTNPWIGYLVDSNAAGIRAGVGPRHTVDEVVAADQRQTAQLREVVDVHLPAILAGNGAPLIIGGDLNTLPAADWTEQWSGAPNHLGMSYPLTATPVLTDAGLVDAYRAVNPDAGADEGRTWCPLPTERLIAPDRIDALFTRGAVRPVAAQVVDQRLRRHGAGTFYSDHAAVVTDVVVTG